MRKRRAVTLVLSLLVMILATAFSVSADQYTDMFDKLYADIKENPEAVTQLTSELVFYEPENLFVVYSTDKSTICLFANIPPDFVTNQMVSVAVRDSYTLTCDGELVSDPDMTALTKPGNYLLQCFTGDGNAAVAYEFTIVPFANPITSKMYMELPSGMEFSFVTLNDKEITPEDNPGQLLMEEEGMYSIEYTVKGTEYYNKTVLITDHTPPTLLLPEVKDGVAASAVTLEDYTPSSSSIHILLDGASYSLPVEKILSEPGNYQITVTDEAGNSSYYEFTIRMYFTISSWMVILCVVGVVVAVVVFVVKTRRNIRVR